MSEKLSESISLFRSQLENRRFCGKTIQILESVLVTKDVKSLIEIRSALSALIRSEAMSILVEIAEKPGDQRLCIVEFLVQAFALVGDAESCLALKYEALVLRETKYHNSSSLRVSYEEWLTFAEDSLANGFHSMAVKGFESALLCIQSNTNVDSELGTFIGEEHIVKNIKKLRDLATTLIASHSVQTQTAVYLERKDAQQGQNRSSCSTHAQYVASSVFRSGIKKRNMHKLYKSRGLHQDISGP